MKRNSEDYCVFLTVHPFANRNLQLRCRSLFSSETSNCVWISPENKEPRLLRRGFSFVVTPGGFEPPTLRAEI